MWRAVRWWLANPAMNSDAQEVSTRRMTVGHRWRLRLGKILARWLQSALTERAFLALGERFFVCQTTAQELLSLAVWTIKR